MIKVGDRVSYSSVYALGRLMVKGGTGQVMEIKPDPYGKTSRQVAIVKGNRGKKFVMFASALKVVN